MTAFVTLGDLDALEAPTAPLFPVEPVPAPGPDPRLWPEIERQKAFITYIRRTSPDLIAFAIPNAGKRGFKAQRQFKAEGGRSGVFDTFVGWDWRLSNEADPARSCAWVELKGFSAAGRPGVLSPAQIEFGNDMHQRGFAVGCFYTATAALRWLASLGAPLRGKL